ncbi:Acetylesterase [Exophiala dermatitidis]
MKIPTAPASLATAIYLAHLISSVSVAGFGVPRHSSNSGHSSPSGTPWSVSNFDSLITFGDSYTDESRLGWFINHNGSAPPAGTLLPESNSTAGGGRTWPRYVVQYTGSTDNGAWTPQMTLYNYAVSGAVCSNEVTPRYEIPTYLPLPFYGWFSTINSPFPSVLDYEIPAFRADLTATRINSTPSTPYFTPSLTASSAVYALWIGTNDLGVWAFLTDSQIRGKVLSDYTSCIYEVFDNLYASGGRRFVLMNTAPLELAPLYANASLHGVGDNQYWPDKASNLTQIAETMREYTSTVNTVFRYQTPFDARVANRYPGAEFALFDVHGLVLDIYNNPTTYLNGTGVGPGSESVWGYENHCTVNQTVCVKRDNGTNSDAFLWFDELHPSEQTDRIIARHFVDVLNGNSTYATYY